MKSQGDDYAETASIAFAYLNAGKIAANINFKVDI
jgi:hypothetical protein